MKKHAAPIIAAILLLLPVLYVGSYFALVAPGTGSSCTLMPTIYPYRCQGVLIAQFYWPLEQIDRKLRPGAWEP